jgi:N-acetylglucosamine kinase-like BadF-type ATPase
VASNHRVILALDAGGTATRCILATTEGQLLGFGIGGPANHILRGWETARESVKAAIGAAVTAAGEAGGKVDIAIAGSAGVGPDGEGREVIEALLAELVPQAAIVRATGDMVAAFWGALSTPIGVVVSAGTGSVCFGRNVTGVTSQVGGWGPVMGDEGSAYDIAVQGLRAVAYATDGRGQPTLLTSSIAEALGGYSAIDIAVQLYGKPLEREEIAALAVQVFASAQQRDPAAIAILRRAGRSLGIAAAAALRNVGLLSTPTSVSYSGSVFEAGAFISEPFRETIHDAAPLAKVEPPILPPIGGAFRLGLQALGQFMDEAITYRLASGLVQAGL